MLLDILTIANIKIMRKVIYQVGVDVLGFPIYVEHYIYQDKLKDFEHEKKNHWVGVVETTIKQH
jgi:hypothetical protein